MKHINLFSSIEIGSYGPTLIIAAILLLFFLIYRIFHRINPNEAFNRYIRKFLLPFTFGSGLLVYFWGYQVGNSGGELHDVFSNALESFFSTTRLFILGNDLVEIEAPFKHEPYFHALFALTASLAAFIFIAFLVQVFFKDMKTRSKIRQMKPVENHFFFGISKAALSLSDDLIKNNQNRLVVFINDFCEFDNPQQYAHISTQAYVIKRKLFSESVNLEKEEGILQFIKGGGSHLHAAKDSEVLFHHLKVLRDKIDGVETHMYFLTDDEDWNIKQARKAIGELKNVLGDGLEMIPPKPIVRIHVATYNEMSEKHFTKSLKESKGKVNIVVHNYATLVSRQLIEKNHPVDFVAIDKEKAVATTDFNALIIGFGQIGTHILRKLIEQGQFVESTFNAAIIDRNIRMLEGRFEHLYPGVKPNYDLHFVEAEVGHHLFYETVRSVIDKTNYIVIALGNDNLNIQTALELLEIDSIKNKKLFKIYIQLEDNSHWKNTLLEYKKWISIFGESDTVFSEKNILQREVEMAGRLVHDIYNIMNNSTSTYDEIDRHDQLSNISSAEHLYAKVRMLGYESLDDFSSILTSNEAYLDSLSKDQLTNLSIGEHLRWNAFHFVHGWTTIPIDEIPGETADERYPYRKDVELRKHACLTTWEKLVPLGALIDRDMQEYDTNSVRHLYRFVSVCFDK